MMEQMTGNSEDRGDRADRADRGDRADRADRGDRADRADRGAQPDRAEKGEELVEALRLRCPEQLLVLLRMHLSFLMDVSVTIDCCESPTDKPKSFKRTFQKLLKNNETPNSQKNSIPGTNRFFESLQLNDENAEQFYQLINILNEEENLCQEGVFRRTGSLIRQQSLRKLLSGGGRIEHSKDIEFSAHDMASVLKAMLADMQEPLLLNRQYQAFDYLSSTFFENGELIKSCEQKLISSLRLLLLLLPSTARSLSKRLLLLLQKTKSLEHMNRMSSSALATMFTPHLMCPRKGSPEALCADSQKLAPILSFMIDRVEVVYTVPASLATDIAVYLAKQDQKRLLSPNNEDLNESVTEKTAANTVFTFVDRQMSGAAADGPSTSKTTSTTDAELAQLYAYIQSLPESQKKRRLIKQFNRENGHGTPLQMQRAQKQKSLGESLKKHLFHKNLISRSGKKQIIGLENHKLSGASISKSKLNFEASAFKINTLSSPLKETDKSESELTINTRQISKSEDNLIQSNLSDCLEVENDEDLHPLLKIDRHSPKYISEPNLTFDTNRDEEDSPTDSPSSEVKIILNAVDNMTTPKIYKNNPRLHCLTSTPNIGKHYYEGLSTPVFVNTVPRRGSMSPISKSTQKMPRAMQESIMTPRSRKPVIINCDLQPTMISNQNTDNSLVHSESSDFDNDSDFVSTDESANTKSSAIKYHQIDDTQCFNSSKEKSDRISDRKLRVLREGRHAVHENLSDVNLIDDTDFQSSLEEHGNLATLSSPFKQYLICRSILTDTPVDLSFVSQPDDYRSVDKTLQNVSENKLSESMMYCLDGNYPSGLDSSMLSCSTEMSHLKTDKENISPGTKRSAGSDQSLEYQLEGKKFILQNEHKAELSSSSSLKDINDYCYDRETLWETDL